MSLPEALFARYFTVGLQGADGGTGDMPPRSGKAARAPQAVACTVVRGGARLLVPVRFTARGHFGRPMQGPAWAAGRRRRLRRPCCGHSFGWRRLRPGHLFSGSVCGGALAAAKRRALCLRAGAGLFSGVAGAPPASGENGRLRYTLHLWGAAPGGGAACGKQMAGAAPFLCAGARAYAYRAL